MTLQALTLTMLQSLFLHEEHVLRWRFGLDGTERWVGAGSESGVEDGQP